MKFYDLECKNCSAHIEWAYSEEALCNECLDKKWATEAAVRAANAAENKVAMAALANHKCPDCGTPVVWRDRNYHYACQCWRNGEGGMWGWDKD